MGIEPPVSLHRHADTCLTAHSLASVTLPDPSPCQKKHYGMFGCEGAAEPRFTNRSTLISYITAPSQHSRFCGAQTVGVKHLPK